VTETTAEATVEEFWERVRNGGEVTAIDELVDPGVVLHTSGTHPGVVLHNEWDAGRSARRVRRVGGGVPGRIGGPRFVTEDLFSSGDRVVTRWRIEGTQQGMVDPSAIGEPVSFTDVTGFVVENGRLREGWVERSAYELFQDLRPTEDRTGQDRTGQDRTGQDRTGQDSAPVGTIPAGERRSGASTGRVDKR
jgi:predicted ester cyclase